MGSERGVRTLVFTLNHIRSHWRLLSRRVTWSDLNFLKDHSDCDIESRLLREGEGRKSGSRKTNENAVAIWQVRDDGGFYKSNNSERLWIYYESRAHGIWCKIRKQERCKIWKDAIMAFEAKQMEGCLYACSVTQSCLTLCNPMDCSPPDSSVHGILQVRILEWVAIAFSREMEGWRCH